MVDRRAFCEQSGCAALGVLSLAVLPASAGSAGASRPRGDEHMESKISSVVGKVISIKGTCGAGHRVGDTMTFSEQGVEGKVCIHALYSMLPAVFAMLFDAKFPWLENPDRKTHACPDAANPVVFELTRIRT
jgi:uncharacterized repeat protein (TIGR04076 family)